MFNLLILKQAAQIPIRDDTEANVALEKAKERFEQDMMEHGSPPWTYPSLHGSLLKQYGKHTKPNSLHEA